MCCAQPSPGRTKVARRSNAATRDYERHAQTRMNRPPPHVHGKEGVDGSSPSEGSAETPHVGALSFRRTCSLSNVRWVWSGVWSSRVEHATRRFLSLAPEARDAASHKPGDNPSS